MVEANSIEIWTEDFGDTADATILLIMGASAQGIVWPDEFCDSLVEAGRHVIRYDNRDTGQSSCFDFSAHPYIRWAG
jgi:pimeloyl-ACP methyl ester carboxylesterase